MNIVETIDRTISEIVDLSNKLALYKRVLPWFEGVEFPENIYTYIVSWQNGKEIKAEFSPAYGQDNKDLQPFVHALCQKFSLKLERRVEYGGETIEYKGRTTLPNGVTLILQVSDCVPGSCKIEETLEEKTPEELEEERAQALKNIEPFRKVRKIVCVEKEEPDAVLNRSDEESV